MVGGQLVQAAVQALHPRVRQVPLRLLALHPLPHLAQQPHARVLHPHQVLRQGLRQQPLQVGLGRGMPNLVLELVGKRHQQNRQLAHHWVAG